VGREPHRGDEMSRSRGRPAKDPRDRRDQLVATRISANERILLEAFCDAHQLTVAEAIRLFTTGCLVDPSARHRAIAWGRHWVELARERRQELFLKLPRVYRERGE
jgi:hypothetical protein